MLEKIQLLVAGGCPEVLAVYGQRFATGIEKPKGASLHLLRHTMASHMLANGVPLPAVSARLGHSGMQTMLRIYGHMIHGQDDEAVRKWEEYQERGRMPGQQTKSVQ